MCLLHVDTRSTVQVHPGLSVNIKAHTQSPTDTHTPMHVSWNETPAFKPTNTVISARTQAYVMEAVAPAAAVSKHYESPYSASQSISESVTVGDELETGDLSINVLQQHLREATAESISSATEALSLIQPALGLQPNLTDNSLLLDSPSASSQPVTETEDLAGSSQVHMGFNHSVIHDSLESHGFASVNGTDVVPISEMPDHVDQDSSDSSADWAQQFDFSASDDITPVSPSVMPEEEDSLSTSSAASATPASHPADESGLESTLYDGIVSPSDEALSAIQSAEAGPASSLMTAVSSGLTSSESLRPEELTPEVGTTDESEWVQVDPYSDSLQGMIHPTSRILRAPGK